MDPTTAKLPACGTKTTPPAAGCSFSAASFCSSLHSALAILPSRAGITVTAAIVAAVQPVYAWEPSTSASAASGTPPPAKTTSIATTSNPTQVSHRPKLARSTPYPISHSFNRFSSTIGTHSRSFSTCRFVPPLFSRFSSSASRKPSTSASPAPP